MDAAIKKISIEEKIALVEELWEEIEQERKSGPTKFQLEILEERRKKHLENPSSGISLKNFIEKYK